MTTKGKGGVLVKIRKEMKEQLEKMRINKALKNNVPSSTDHAWICFMKQNTKSSVGERKFTPKNDEYLGPYKVESSDRIRNLVFIYHLPDQNQRLYILASIKPY